MTTPSEDPTSLDDRLREEPRSDVAPVQPSPELRAPVERLTRQSRVGAWTRRRRPLVGAAAMAVIAVLASVVLIRGDHDARPGVESVASAQPFAPEPTPSPELDDDPPTAVTYSDGEHGTPSDEFRAVGQAAAQALHDNDYQALAALQDPSAQQPNTIAGLIAKYGGHPVRVLEYIESSISAFPWAAVDYFVSCSSGRAVRFSLTFNHIDGRWALLPDQQEDLAIAAAQNAAAPSGDMSQAVPDPTESVRPGTMRYPACSG